MSINRPFTTSLRTHPGRVRDHNEDFVTYREPLNSEDEAQNGWLYIVADGVGGAEAGEVASQYASERTIDHYLNSNQVSDLGQRLQAAMQSANTDLRQLVADRGENSRMATTMVAIVYRAQTAYIANVGDSRGYLWRAGALYQITKDQSLVAKLVEEGAITEAEAAVHPRKNVILYSLGSEKEPQIDLFEQAVHPGDVFLLCSDGLTRHVSDEEMAAIVSQHEPEMATQALVHLANSRGGEDNISVAVLKHEMNLTKTKVISNDGVAKPSTRHRSALWFYTIVLSLVQTILIVLAWLLLHI